MAVTVHVHPSHLQFTQDQETVSVQGRTVGECLRQLVRQFPDLENVLFTKKDQLHNTIEVYLNQDSAYPDELAKPVNDGDEIHLLVMLSGG